MNQITKSEMQLIAVLVMMLAYQSAVAALDVPKSPGDVCPIKVGQTLPYAQITSIEGKTIELTSVVEKKPSILIFYRGSWCPYCNLHLGELKTVEKELKDMGYQIVAISPDLPANLTKAVNKHTLTYDLYSDSKAEAAKALGLAFEQQSNKKSFLSLLEGASGEPHHILPVPAAIVIDKKGVVKFVFHSPDYTVRVDKEVLLVAAKSALK